MRHLLVLTTVFAMTTPVLAEKGDKGSAPALEFKLKNIDGKEVDLTKYKGKVVMFVNVASRCGLTPQYEQLQGLHDKYADKGLVIIGVPANEFGKQEPGTNAQIKEFCTSEYKVKFPMMAKVVVKGEGIDPLFSYLTTKTGKHAGELKWNFTKFLVGKNGEVVARFEPRVKPDASEVIETIEAELKK